MVSVSTRLSLWDRRDRLSVMKTERVILCVQCMQILTNCELVWEWVVRIEKVCESDCVSLGREPWSCGYVRQLMSERLWVQIPGLYEMSFFTLICCKNCIVCFKRPKINKKEAGVGPFKKNKQEVSCTCWVFSALGEAYLRSDDVVATKSLLVSLPFYGIFFLYWWDTLSSNSSPLARLTSCA